MVFIPPVGTGTKFGQYLRRIRLQKRPGDTTVDRVEVTRVALALRVVGGAGLLVVAATLWFGYGIGGIAPIVSVVLGSALFAWAFEDWRETRRLRRARRAGSKAPGPS